MNPDKNPGSGPPLTRRANAGGGRSVVSTLSDSASTRKRSAKDADLAYDSDDNASLFGDSNKSSTQGDRHAGNRANVCQT